MTTLFLDGRSGTGKDKLRFLAVIDGVEFWLRQKLFTYLFKLAIQGRGDWIHKSKLEPGRNVDIHVWHLRKAIKSSGLNIENDRQGHYRLAIDFDSIGYDLDNIKAFPDATVRRLV